MDEERGAAPTSPKPPDHGGTSSTACNATATTSNTTNSTSTTTTDTALTNHKRNTETPKGFKDIKTCPAEDVVLTYTEPRIIRSNGPQRIVCQDGDGPILPHTDISSPAQTVTCQPMARSTPLHHTQPCRTQPCSGHLRNGPKLHCLHHTLTSPHHAPLTHTVQANGVRNGGPHPKLGSLPRGGSSTSSSSSAGPRHSSRKLRSNPSITSQSSKRSKSSSKSNSSQVPTEGQDDCCVHCILACLFCEFLTLCNIVLDCATCGSCAGDDSCFCCCCASEECGDCDLPCDMDCGIIDACCESADCLEICMECCSLCFSS
ncbi:uncharacterized protein [Eucyclogobius newberryi]|uniref:uncharacterized protein n=1 Tax=Eucyclogobius newberryi TaxID=166745 RepID=UPI003B5AE948